MELQHKLVILADSAKYDASCASGGSRRRATSDGFGNTTGVGICHSYTPDGRCVSLLKILLTNVCIYDCLYCVNRISSDIPRARFTIDEVVSLTLDFYRRNYIEGLFLSSGVIQCSDYTMEQLVEVARRLREDHHFNGYIHLKGMPDASALLLAAAGRYADRVSVNVELPTPADLNRLAPDKSHDEISSAMSTLRERIDEAQAERKLHARAPEFAPAGQSTQMIVGATATSDRAILDTASDLYARHRLRRVYYSAFSPIPSASAALPARSAPLVREHRLYQADWLLRFYGFHVDELTTTAAPNLDSTVDPKTAWALRHPELFPVDVNNAARETLLRVPGLGRSSVTRILNARKLHKLTLGHLRTLRVRLSIARPFIVAQDWRPRSDVHERSVEAIPMQPLLWTA